MVGYHHDLYMARKRVLFQYIPTIFIFLLSNVAAYSDPSVSSCLPEDELIQTRPCNIHISCQNYMWQVEAWGSCTTMTNGTSVCGESVGMQDREITCEKDTGKFIEYRSVTSSNFCFCIIAFSWPYFRRTWWKTLTYQILDESVHGGPRYDHMNTLLVPSNAVLISLVHNF